MRMNKKGFTLIELLAVIAIIGLLSLIAVPNVLNIVNNNKKDLMLSDAQKLVSLAKYKIALADSSLKAQCATTCDFTFSDLNTSGTIKSDPDGGDYVTTSFVRYTKTNNVVSYCIFLEGSNRRIGLASNCISEDDLFSRSIVRDK